jgi:4-hydroxyproline epimerase
LVHSFLDILRKLKHIVFRMQCQHIQIIDSHTGGEPTRVVVGGFPTLEGDTMADKREDFRARFDHFRSALINEPRGSDVIVGALLTEPTDPTCMAGVIFFNNVGTIGMCGHGTIGLMVTLAHLGRVQAGEHRIETPVGVVTARLHESGEVSVQNVPSFRHARDVTVEVEGRAIRGDVAWSGNWFYLVNEHGEEVALRNVERLTEFAWQIRQALQREGITGRDGREIDHVELFAPSEKAHSKNFVLCPGKAYDRSPCGTGTSAKLACLFADGKLQEGEMWRQESIVGSVFEGWVNVINGETIPTIKGSAFLTAEATVILNPNDPFCWGIR